MRDDEIIHHERHAERRQELDLQVITMKNGQIRTVLLWLLGLSCFIVYAVIHGLFALLHFIENDAVPELSIRAHGTTLLCFILPAAEIMYEGYKLMRSNKPPYEGNR